MGDVCRDPHGQRQRRHFSGRHAGLGARDRRRAGAGESGCDHRDERDARGQRVSQRHALRCGRSARHYPPAVVWLRHRRLRIHPALRESGDREACAGSSGRFRCSAGHRAATDCSEGRARGLAAPKGRADPNLCDLDRRARFQHVSGTPSTSCSCGCSDRS